MWKNSNQHATDVVENVCPHCGEHLFMNKRSFANHVRWCKKNPKYEELRENTISKIKKSLERNIINKKGDLKKFKVVCAKCGKEFEIEEREKDFPSKKKYYCSKSCANSHKKTEESKKKVSESLKRYARSKGMKVTQDTFQEDKICPICGKIFHTIRVNQVTCSPKCGSKLRTLNILKTKFKKITDDIEKGKFLFNLYRKQCAFKFALNKYQNEYDFSLIKDNGWYKPTNRGDNLHGVSRDHIFSVCEGFKQQIDPYYISHPANCKLLLQSENASKHNNCAITIEELKTKIDEWNKKHGIYENKINYNLLKSVNFDILIK